MIYTRKLILDFETFSEVDLKKRGIDPYAKDPSTLALMLGWRIDEMHPASVIKGKTQIWEPDLNRIPGDLIEALVDPKCLKVAWNAGFEWHILTYVLKIHTPLNQWRDAAVWARALSMPGSLADSCRIMGLGEDKSKFASGKKLIQLFSMPQAKKKLTKKQIALGITMPTGMTRNDRVSHPAEWEQFKAYCIQDVEAEAELDHLMEALPLTQTEQEGWELDQEINMTGLPMNMEFVENALYLALEAKSEATELLKFRTGLANPNSPAQMLKWARERGYPFTSLNKAFVKRALEDPNWGGVTVKIELDEDEDGPVETSDTEEDGDIEVAGPRLVDCTPEMAKDAKEVLAIRLATGKISWKKLEKIKLVVSGDGIARNQFLFLGAGRTGRWSGRGFQPQNLGRPEKEVKKRLDEAIEFIMSRDYERLKKEFKCGVLAVIVSTLRAAIQAPKGFKFVVGDLSSIEYNVLAWLANCPAMLAVANDPDGDPYLEFASHRLGIPYEELLRRYRDGDEEIAEIRQLYKPPVLGCGYGLGPGRQVKRRGNLVKTGLWGYGENMGVTLSREECVASVAVYRSEYVEVTALWANLENAAREVLTYGKPVQVGPVVFSRKVRKNGRYIMQITLPSGRPLTYINARIATIPCKLREWTDKETGEEIQAYNIECSDICGSRWTLKKPMDPESAGYENALADWNSIDANNTIVRTCKKCGCDTVWKRSTEEALIYDGIGHGVGAIGAGWGPTYTYGGKLTENIVQAIARDILLHAMFLARERGLTILGHFHDEILAMVKAQKFGLGLADLLACLKTKPTWAKGLPLSAEGYEGLYYKK